MIRNPVLLACVAALVVSCAGVPSQKSPALGPVSADVLQSAFRSGDFDEAYPAWEHASTQGSIGHELLQTYFSRLVEILDGQIAGAGTRRAMKLAENRSALALFYPAFGALQGMDSAAIRDSYVSECRKQGWSQLVDLLAAPAPVGVSTTPSLAPEVFTQRILDATVTIWVDRGLKVAKGYAVPDIVLGSGFFIEKAGYLITNYHVIRSEVDPEYEGYSRLYVRLGDPKSEKIPARVVGWDPLLDLALLKVELDAPATLSLSGKDIYSPGTKVLAFGSPGGLEKTVSSGIISAEPRKNIALGDVLQIDAAVNPGNSGGPLCDDKGEFVGVVFAGIPEFQGVNFAIPGYYVRKFLAGLFEGGKYRHGWLGLELESLRGHTRVAYVVPGSPAWFAGLRRGDIVVALGGKAIKTPDEFQNLFIGYEAGDLVDIAILRGDGTLNGAVTNETSRRLLLLGERVAHPLASIVEAGYNDSITMPLFGFGSSTLSVGVLGVRGRIEDLIPGSAADEAGFSEGDVFDVLGWAYSKSANAVALAMQIKRKTQGFLEQSLQLTQSIDQSQLF